MQKLQVSESWEPGGVEDYNYTQVEARPQLTCQAKNDPVE